MTKSIVIFLKSRGLRFMRLYLFVLLATASAGWSMHIARAQTPAQAKQYLSLIGKPKPEIYKTLGKPSREQDLAGGDTWKTPNIGIVWKEDEMMTIYFPPHASTWQGALKKHGLSVAGVKTRKTKGDGDVPLFVLTGVKGIPAGWSCAWFKEGGSLEFARGLHFYQ